MSLTFPKSLLSVLLALRRPLRPVMAQDAPSEETIKLLRSQLRELPHDRWRASNGTRPLGADSAKGCRVVTNFLMDPKGTIDAGGEYEQRILADARGVYMPSVPGMNVGLAAS